MGVMMVMIVVMVVVVVVVTYSPGLQSREKNRRQNRRFLEMNQANRIAMGMCRRTVGIRP
jgi:uncharacterized membrane protein